MKKPASLCLLTALLFTISLHAQLYPVSLDQRVEKSSVIAIVTVKEQTSYWDAGHRNIYTRNMLEVKAYIKGHSTATMLAAISPGGVVEDHAEYVCPAETYQPGKEYLVFLLGDNNSVDEKSFRHVSPDIRQCPSYAGPQSVLAYEEGEYKDLFFASMKEDEMLAKMAAYGLEARRPGGARYSARNYVVPSQKIQAVTGITDGTGSTPSGGFVNGTIPANNELIINGSGFGATAGSVQFPSVDNGGAGTVSTVSTDIISWSATQIRLKIPDKAGTGTLNVFDAGSTNVGSFPITIKWGEINVSSTFNGFASAQRQQVELLNWNGSGGYTFEFSTNTTNGASFFADAAAKASFQRAVRTWRCNSLVNFNVLGTTGNATGFRNDSVSIVLYDNTLPAGALGVCTSRFNALAGGPCTLSNTTWFLQEMDIRVLETPVPGYTWNFTTSAPTGLQFDFETVMLHEVGHGHGLTHIINPALTMNWSVSNGVAKRTLSASEIEAGQYRVTQSTANCIYSNFGSLAPHTAISAGSCNILLPVSLIDFSGERNQDKSIRLRWETEWETNVKGFNLERSTDGVNFSSIRYTPSAGNSQSTRTYDVLDNERFVQTIYYRLKTIDNDGSYHYSRIISFQPANNGWQLFPNPAPGKFYVVADRNTPDATVIVTDALGKTVYSLRITSLAAGAAYPVTVSRLPAGVYFARITAAGETIVTQKIRIEK